ncbi:hypothetical protein CJU90_1749 [Yarrowia sp. C11]|nr:hypothetical protein CKK34_0476 [Yarrowia sp. E02]KAG5371691.1 hypothetical protein CJU90_1749 [Yarrowia sp. C11]
MNISDDVARLILEQCDVDDSVALSQTSRRFRALFFANDGLIEKQVKAACPWMEKLESWPKTALLCAVRNKGGDKWFRVSAESEFVPEYGHYRFEMATLGKTVMNAPRRDMAEYNGVFEDVQLPMKPSMFFVRNGAIHVRESDSYENRDYSRIHLNLKDMRLIESPTVLKLPPEDAQELVFTNHIVSPVSGIQVCAADDSYEETIRFVDENDTVMIVGRGYDTYYIYKPEADIVDNKLTFHYQDWKRSAMDENEPPQLVGNSSYVAVVKDIEENTWACLEHASRHDTELIQLMLMEYETRVFCVQVYNGLLFVYKNLGGLGFLYPIWVNLGEKQTVSNDCLYPEEQGKYTVGKVTPAMIHDWQAVGGWETYRMRPVPSFARGDNGRFITVREFRKGGGYRIGDLETGITYQASVLHRNADGKAECVFPSITSDKTIKFFTWYEPWGRDILKHLEKVVDEYRSEEAPPFDSKSQTEAFQILYDELGYEERSDTGSIWSWGSSEYASDDERELFMPSPSDNSEDGYGDACSVDSMTSNEWARLTMGGDIPEELYDQLDFV